MTRAVRIGQIFGGLVLAVVGIQIGERYISRLPQHDGYFLVASEDAVKTRVERPRRTVVVVADGLGGAYARGMRSAGRLQAAGQCRVTDVGPISVSRPVYAVISTVVTLAVCLCAFIFETDDHKVADWAINLVLVSWILHLIAGISLRNNYLRLLAQRQAQDELAPFGIPPLAPAPTYPPPPTPAAPAPVQGLVGMNDFYAPTPAQLDINSASTLDLKGATVTCASNGASKYEGATVNIG